jgi:hypothetical protein
VRGDAQHSVGTSVTAISAHEYEISRAAPLSLNVYMQKQCSRRAVPDVGEKFGAENAKFNSTGFVTLQMGLRAVFFTFKDKKARWIKRLI